MKKMESIIINVKEIIKEGASIFVPLYQRKYQWKEDRILPFWKDVTEKASALQYNNNCSDHFLGTFIFDSKSAKFTQPNHYSIIDGQQRLTTILILLIIIREIANKCGFKDTSKQASKFLLNHNVNSEQNENAQFKLIPTPADQDLFRELIEHSFADIKSKYLEKHKKVSSSNEIKNQAVNTYRFFYDEVTKYINSENYNSPNNIGTIGHNPDSKTKNHSLQVKLNALLTAVLEKMKVAVIYLGDADEAQIIFETLNSRSEPLNAMDLVRNYIFYRAEIHEENVQSLYVKYWESFDGSWWYSDTFARRPRIDHFLSSTLVAQTGKAVDLSKLFNEYKKFVEPDLPETPPFELIEDELKFLNSYSPIYKELETKQSEDGSLQWIAEKLANWRQTTPYPIIMQIEKSDLKIHERSELYNLIYSYIVRRSICGLNSRSFISVFQTLAAEFIKHSVSIDTFKSFFNQRRDAGIRFPDDKEFRESILIRPISKTIPKYQIRDILWRLEVSARGKKSEALESTKPLTIEHILPKNWTNKWQFENKGFVGPESESQQAIDRVIAINKLGNLTLLTEKLNKVVGNSDFITKKTHITTNSLLKLNQWFNDLDRWNEGEIQRRGEYLANSALKIWKGLK